VPGKQSNIGETGPRPRGIYEALLASAVSRSRDRPSISSMTFVPPPLRICLSLSSKTPNLQVRRSVFIPKAL